MPGGNPLYDFTIGLSLNQREIVRSIQKQEAVLKKVYDSALSSAVEANLSRRKLRGLEQVMMSASSRLMETQKEIMKLDQAMRADGLREEVRTRLQAEKDRLELQRKGILDQAKEHEKVAKDAAAAYQQELHKLQVRNARRNAALQQAAQGFGAGKKAGGVFGQIAQMMAGRDVTGLVSLAGKGLKKVGQKGASMEKGLASRAATGSKGAGALLRVLGGLGKVLGKLGPVLLAVGAIAGAFVALIKVLLDAEAKVKEFRSAIIKSNVSALDLGATIYGVTDAVDNVVFAFSGLGKGFDFQRAWGVNAKEALKVVDAYAQAGTKVSIFTSNLKDAELKQEALRKATEAALTYANLLGMEGSEIAQKMGEMMNDLALNLGGVRMQFSGITAIAKESAYSTKKFFSQILQATSGMSMYNVRLEETGVLLKELQEALGAKDGFDLLQKILGVMAGKGMKERMKDMVVGKGGIAARERTARRTATERAKDFIATAGPEFMAVMRAAASKLGLKLDTATPEKMMRSLSKLSEKDRGLLEAAIQDLVAGNKEMEGQIRAMASLFRASDVFKTGGGQLERYARLAASESDLGPMYALDKLKAVMDRAFQMGKGRVGTSKLVAEELGIDLKTANMIQDFYRRQEGQLDYLRKAAEGKKEGEIGLGEQDMAARFGMFFEWSKDLNKYIIRQGTQEKPGAVVNTLEDMLYANKDAYTKMIEEGKQQEDIKLAREIAGATTKSTKILEQIMDGVLANIFKYVSMIWGLMFKSDAENAAEAGAALRKKLLSGRRQAEDNFRIASEQLSRINAAIKETDDPGALTKLEQEKTSWEQKRASARRAMEGQTDLMMKLDERLSGDPKWIQQFFKAEWGNLDSTDRRKAEQRILAALVDGNAYQAALIGNNEKAEKGELDYWAADLAGTNVLKIQAEKTNKTLSAIEEKLRQQLDEQRKARELENAAAGAAGAVFSKLPETARAKFSIPFLETVMRDILGGKMTTGTAQTLKENQGLARAILQSGGLPPAMADAVKRAAGIEDGLVRIGRNRMEVMRIREDDIIRAGTPAGPLSRAGGGGAKTVTNNFWEGKSAFASLRDYERAKGQYK